VLPADRLDASSLVQAIEASLDVEPARVALDLDGAGRTAQLVEALIHGGRASQARRTAEAMSP
jgi:hypothetical protein